MSDGYTLKEISDIFETAREEQDLQLEQEAIHFACMLSDFDFSESLSDVPIIYYVAGYICRQLIKATKCKDCHALFSENQESLTVVIEDNGLTDEDVKEGKAFVEAISRGGLTKPSDVLHVVCMHASDLFRFIRKDFELKKELLGSINSRSLFVEAFLVKLDEQESTHSILSIKCKSEHSFSSAVRKIVVAMFNLFAKNLIADVNSEIHKNRKRNKDAEGEKEVKRDPSKMKSKKLKSEA